MENDKETFFQNMKPKVYRDKIKSELDILNEDFLAGRPELIEVPCPFCNTKKENEQSPYFSLAKMSFYRCLECSSFYNTPRLTQQALADYYALQPTVTVDDKLLPEVRLRRVEKIMKPRWGTLKTKLQEAGLNKDVKVVMEIGAGIGHFIEVLQEDKFGESYIAVEPSLACHKELKKLERTKVVGELVENISEDAGNCDVIFINSVIEHPHSLKNFFSSVAKLLKPGGYVGIVDMHSGGLDLEVLRSDAQNVNPFLIQQVPSVDGISKIATANGLELIDVFSMGQMDVDILYEFAKSAELENPLKGFQYVFDDKKFRDEFQSLLKKYNKTGYFGCLLKKA